MKDFINENKFPIMLSVLFIILVVISFNLYKILMPDTNQAVYGSRLDNKVKLEKEEVNKVIDKIKESDKVVKVTHKERGILLTYLVTVKEDTKLSEAKDIRKIILEHQSEEIVKSYDIQIIVLNEDEENEIYPIMGYKNKSRKSFSWTKDRVVKE